MMYSGTTDAYNDRRYGRPWMAICSRSINKDFEFLAWEGRNGYAGEFIFEVPPGTLLASGQKDLRKGRGGVDQYHLAMPDGLLNPVDACRARDLIKIFDLAERVRMVAQERLEWWTAIGPHSLDRYRAQRFDRCGRYAQILGVENPALVEVAKAFGLREETEPAPAAVDIDLAAFGF